MTKDVFNVGCLDPVRAVWKTFVIEDKPVCRGYRTVHNESKKM